MNLAELRASVAQEKRRLTVTPDELRADVTDPGTPRVVGHAAVFDRLSEDLGGFRERIKRGAFRKALDEHQDVRLLVNHEGVPLARTKSQTLELSEDPRGLRAYAELDPTNPDAQRLVSAMRRGDVDQMSFGFSVAKGGDKWDEKDGVVTRTILQVEKLYDVSPVAFPAYPQTDAGLRMERVGADLARLDDEAHDMIVAEIRSLHGAGVAPPEIAESDTPEELRDDESRMASADAGDTADEGMGEHQLLAASLEARWLEARIAAL